MQYLKKTEIFKTGWMIVFSLLMTTLMSCDEGKPSVTSSTPNTTEQGIDVIQQAGWELVWQDEFDDTIIDTEKWQYEFNCAGGGNNELQCYTPRADNSFVKDGLLHVVAREETFNGPSKFDDDPTYDPNDTSKTQHYTSARLRTKNKGDWKYGRLEIRAKLPQGQGVWPAIWMLPTDWIYGGWPNSGEIDIMEAVNSNAAGGNKIHGTLHYGKFWPENSYTGQDFEPENSVWEQFHTYTIEWQEGEIRWYVDQTHYATQTKDGWFTYYFDGQNKGFKVAENSEPFDQAFHLIINLAVGGNWPGSPDDSTQFPQELLIDFVKVYECKHNTDTGEGCQTYVDESIEPLNGQQPPLVEHTSLYTNQPETLSFQLNGSEITNTLRLDSWAPTDSNVVVSETDIGGEHASVLDILFNGVGNVFLASQNMSNTPDIDTGLQFTSMDRYGEIAFDLFVESAETNTQLNIKLDSGWPNLSEKTIDLPSPGEWHHISIPIEQFEANSVEPGQVNLQKVINPFVVETKGSHIAHIKIDNIELICLENCGVNLITDNEVLTGEFDIFIDDIDQIWDLGLVAWDTALNTNYSNGDTTGAHITWSTIDDDSTSNRLLDINFLADDNNGVLFVQSSIGKNATTFTATGKLVFNIRVLDYGNNTSGMVIKVDCGHPCGSGDYPIGVVGNHEWETVEIPIQSLIDHPGSSLDLSKLNTPIVIFPVWGEQQGVHFQLDEVRWVEEN